MSAIYIRLPNWVGDVCMSLPSLEAVLHSGLPAIVCARPWARALLDAYPLAGFIPMSGHWRDDATQVRAFRRQAGHRDALGLLLPDSLSSALIFRLAGIPAAGHRDDGRSLLLRWRFVKSTRPLHAVEAWYRLTHKALSQWGRPPAQAQAPRMLSLRISAEAQAAARRILDQAGLAAGGFVLIAPTAIGRHKGRNKVWPHFDALTRQLQAAGHTVAMCPPESERDQAMHNVPSALCLPATSLASFATLCRQAALVVCNDSGVSHLAAASGARQLTLFGVTDAGRTGPWSPKASCLGTAQAWPGPQTVLQEVKRLLCEAPPGTAPWNYPDT